MRGRSADAIAVGIRAHSRAHVRAHPAAVHASAITHAAAVHASAAIAHTATVHASAAIAHTATVHAPAAVSHSAAITHAAAVSHPAAVHASPTHGRIEGVVEVHDRHGDLVRMAILHAIDVVVALARGALHFDVEFFDPFLNLDKHAGIRSNRDQGVDAVNRDEMNAGRLFAECDGFEKVGQFLSQIGRPAIGDLEDLHALFG